MVDQWMLYGAYGYTGTLVARRAVSCGLSPILAGRRREPLQRLARELDLDHRVLDLSDGARLAAGLEDAALVVHAAGPFAVTAAPMVEACLAARTHYVDVTGEVDVFEQVAARHDAARRAGILLLPGAGMDVVPSDCLAARLAERMPDAHRLHLALLMLGKLSHGTASTILHHFAEPTVARRGGELRRLPASVPWRPITYTPGRPPVPSIPISWGDVTTAWHTTGIPTVTVSMGVPDRGRRLSIRLARRLSGLTRWPIVRRHLQARIDASPPGPDEAERAAGRGIVWGEVEAPDGRRLVDRLVTPDGYTLTATAVTEIVTRLLACAPPTGFGTPARVFGWRLARDLPGVEWPDADGYSGGLAQPPSGRIPRIAPPRGPL